MRRKHVPQRTCVACRTVQSKRDLVRIVRTPADVGRQGAGVEIDPTGKRAGRGAYLCRARPCWDVALARNVLNRALKTTLTAEERAELAAYAASLPSELPAPEPASEWVSS